MQSIARHFRPADGLILIAAFAVTALYTLAAGGNFPLDDSWIHQTYGRNLAHTGQWAFVSGVPSAASTSPLYTVVLAIGYALNLPFRLWTHGIGALSLGLTGMIGMRLAERLAPDVRRIGVVTGLALVLAWHLIWAAASGMETAIFAMLTLLLILLAWRELDARSEATQLVLLRGAVFGAVAALLTLTRPEGVLLVGMIGVALVIVRPGMTWRTIILWGGAALALFALLLAPYLIFNYQITGGLLPNTAAAKRVYSMPLLDQPYLWRIGNVVLPLLAGGQILLIPGIVAFTVVMFRRLRRERVALLLLLPLLWGVGLILLYAAWLPLNFQHSRYLMPALPSLIIAGVVGTAWIIRRMQATMLARVVSSVLALSAVGLFLVFAFAEGLRAYVQDVTIIDQEMVATAHWLSDNVPPNELLAVHDIGAVGYFAPRPILDIAGLVTPEIVPILHDPAAMWSFIAERDARYLMVLDNQIPGESSNRPALCLAFTTGGETAVSAGGSNMTIYGLAWDGECS